MRNERQQYELNFFRSSWKRQTPEITTDPMDPETVARERLNQAYLRDVSEPAEEIGSSVERTRQPVAITLFEGQSVTA